jgi:two-component system LytT family response regulator
MNAKVAIIDDEPSARNAIRKMLLGNCSSISILGEAGSVAEGAALIRQESPDLLLLDVEMEDGTGFDLLDQVSPIRFNIIFITAHHEFAIRAFRYNAIDYLLKPVHPDELVTAIGKARQNSNFALLQRQIDNLIANTATQSLPRIALPTGDGLVFTPTKDIVRIESYGNFAYVFLTSGERILVSLNLRVLEETLSSPPFFRSHQSHILNTAFVKKYIKEDGGYAVMQDGAQVPIARRKKEAFLAALQD